MKTRYLQNAWFFGGWSNLLNEGEARKVTLAEQEIAVYRSAIGKAAAISNTCPHRFAPLHLGKVKGEVLECGYHGLQFGPDGRCAHNPHSPTAASGAVRVRSYPVAERDGAIWIWLDDEVAADPARIPDMSWLSTCPATASRPVPTMHLAAHYELIADNLLDPTHADYLHAGTLGGTGDLGRVKPTCRAAPYMLEFDWTYDGLCTMPFLRGYLPGVEQVDTWLISRWHAPGVCLVLGGIKPAGAPRDAGLWSASYHIFMPSERNKSTYDVMTTRSFALDDTELSDSTLQFASHIFNAEDKPMIEAQQLAMGDRDFWELKPTLFPTDGPAVKVRRALQALIDERTA